MLVRIYNAESRAYYKSEVYAIINSGWYEKRLVIVPSDKGDHFKLIDFFDKSDPKSPKPVIDEMLQNGLHEKLGITYKKTDDVNTAIDEYKESLIDGIKLFHYYGYTWVFNNIHFFTELLKGGEIPTKGFEEFLVSADDYKLSSWNYVETQEDIDSLLEQVSSFHDTVLKDLDYTSGAYVDDKKAMHPTNRIARVTMRFDSQWSEAIELVFESVISLHLRPSLSKYSGGIMSASLFTKDLVIFFCDGEVDGLDIIYNSFGIEAYSLRWRFCS
jgi:hypothetical protein